MLARGMPIYLEVRANSVILKAVSMSRGSKGPGADVVQAPLAIVGLTKVLSSFPEAPCATLTPPPLLWLLLGNGGVAC